MALQDAKGKPIIRPYTPVSSPDQKGELALIVKKYETGNASKYIHSLKVSKLLWSLVIVLCLMSFPPKEGDTLAMKGPILKFPYKS